MLFLHNFLPTHVLQANPDNIIIGSHVWIGDPVVAWIDGEVIQITGHQVHVRATNGKMVHFQIIP